MRVRQLRVIRRHDPTHAAFAENVRRSDNFGCQGGDCFLRAHYWRDTWCCAIGDGPRRESLSAEVNPFRGTLTYTRFATPRWELGVGLGFGFPQLDQTLFRKRDDFRDFLNVSALARRHFGKHALIEMGLRLGAAEYHECTASDCWPEVYLGPSILFAVGSERIKVGPRLTFGSIAAQGKDSDVFASVSPVNLLVSWRW